jgi:hypothetical protein
MPDFSRHPSGLFNMKQVDYFKTIFQLFLGFLSKPAVDDLIQRCRQVEAGESASKEFQRLLELPAGELTDLIQRHGDEEDKVKYLNVLLWRQSLGQIPSSLRVQYTFEEPYYNWLIHRAMVANGYEWTNLAGKVVAQGDATQPYAQQIETHLNNFETSEDLEGASHLALLLNVIGPKLASYTDRSRVVYFTQRLIERQHDHLIEWLSLPAFILLAHDLSFPPGESWPLVQRLVRLEHNRTIFNYPGWIVAIRSFGQAAKDELKQIDVPGGYDLLEMISET